MNINGNAYFDGNNTINGNVWTLGNYIRGSNVVFNSGYVEGGITYENAATVYLNGTSQGGLELAGDVSFGRHDGVLNLANDTWIRGDVTANAIANATVNFQGSGEIEGAVGPLKAINVQANGSLVQLNTVSGDTTVGSINYSADQAVVEVQGQLTGNVNMNGHYSKLSLVNRPDEASAGMSGVLDFGMSKSNQALAAPDTYGMGTLEVGNNVDVTFNDDPTQGIKLTNADNATVVFAGNSTVTGDLGSADASKHNTPYRIYAGATNGGTGGTVTFQGRVYVGAGNLNIGPSNNTVVLNGGLTGNLVFGTGTPVSVQGTAYSTYGDGGVNGTWGDAGTVELADNQTITGSITTITNGTGNMLFMGSSAYANSIGASDKRLATVVFNADTLGTSAAPVRSTIAGNVYANLVTIGNGSAYTTATMTPGAHILGNYLTLAGANTVLNLDGASNTAFTPNADGTLSNATSSRVTVDGGTITTNGATLNFSVDAGNVLAKSGQVVPATSSVITTTGTLVMSGAEKVNVVLLGSTRNGATATLIGVGSNPTLNGPAAGSVTDNSFVIDTQVSETSAGLVMAASRAQTQYISKSATTGHFSNPAADRLGKLAADGSGYTSDMQTVFNKLDINQWGFGNNQANLANQVKRLAPIANASGVQAALASTTSALSAVGERLSVLRGDVAMAGLSGNGREMGTENTGWVKVLGSSGKAQANGDYDGYKVTNSGLVAGADAKVSNGVVGGSFSYVASNISQQDFRLGDTAKMNSGTLAVYGTQEYGDVFVDGALAFSQHSLDSSRATAIARIAKADVDMNQTTLKLSAGYRIGIDDSKVNVLTPMVSLEAASLKQKAYSETGADALSLNVDSKNMSRTRASLGLRFNTVIEGSSTTFYPELMVALNRNTGMRNTDVAANYAGDTTATAFTTTGVVLPKSSYTVGAGLRFATSKTSEVQIGYRYEGGHGLTGSSAQVRGAWSF